MLQCPKGADYSVSSSSHTGLVINSMEDALKEAVKQAGLDFHHLVYSELENGSSLLESVS